MHGTKSLKFEVPQFCSGKLRELKFVGYVAVSDSTGAKFRRFILRHPIPNSV